MVVVMQSDLVQDCVFPMESCDLESQDPASDMLGPVARSFKACDTDKRGSHLGKVEVAQVDLANLRESFYGGSDALPSRILEGVVYLQ
jgi:hypothetical protein